MYTYLVSTGAQAMKQLPDGQWRAAFDSDEAVTAYEFVDDLLKEQVEKAGKSGPMAYRGADFGQKWTDGKVAMQFSTLQSKELGDINPQLMGIAPIPKGPTGIASSEVNCPMYAIFAGQKDKRVRDAAWKYIWFTDSVEARRIFVQTMVEQGAARTLRPKLLRQFGFSELADLAIPGLEEAYETALAQGTPEPYGKNCQFVYAYMTKPMDAAYYFDFKGMTRQQKRAKIKEFLRKAVDEANEQMIGIVPEPVRKKRNGIAWVVAVVVLLSFVLLLRQVFRWMSQGFAPSTEPASGYKNRMAVALIAPALLLILLWQYYPLVRGSLMAFQDYSIMGGSPWIGIDNFADVLFDKNFWLALKNAVYFCALWMLMGFLPPMALAIILQEIPLGKLLFRILFYLPHLVSGIVIYFMWRGFYDVSPDGILNRILAVFNIPAQKWLDDPNIAMICVVFPIAWSHLGAGCIIYLAALKGIPDELYEAADIDGASFFQKLRFIVFSYLKPLIVINAVGATIFGFKSADAVLAMTGGGPNGATQVIGYEIWQRSFMFLHFSQATAMAWILGVLLLSFTAYQLRILNKVEFRTTGK
jgi:multiple sugar transport system permease protein